MPIIYYRDRSVKYTINRANEQVRKKSGSKQLKNLQSDNHHKLLIMHHQSDVGSYKFS